MKFAAGSGAWLAALCASRVLSAAWFVAYSAVLPLVREDWALSARDAGMIQGAFHLGYLASLFIVGFLADHFGAKRTCLTAGVASAANSSRTQALSLRASRISCIPANRSDA